jgi:hypothetical protein
MISYSAESVIDGLLRHIALREILKERERQLKCGINGDWPLHGKYGARATIAH